MTDTQQKIAGPRIVDGLHPTTEVAHTPAVTLDSRTYSRALDCVHCGLCLPACPTYTQNGLEADSPRGRIYLMKGLADGKVEPSETVLKHLDLCLDCRACETACPSGVVYHELIEETRAKLAPQRTLSGTDRLVRAIFLRLFTSPLRLKLSLLPARILQKLGLWSAINRSGLPASLPKQLQKMHQMLPEDGPLWEKKLQSFYPAKAPDGKVRAKVALFPGCVGSVLFQHVNRQTIALYQLAGCDVHVPPAAGCCGAIHHHAGVVEAAEKMARHNIDTFLAESDPKAFDYIVSNIAGCGAQLKDYAHLLRDDEKYADRAKQFVARVRDVSEVLAELELPEAKHVDRTVTYHDACHLAHGQKVTDPPRRLLGRVPGLKLIPLAESDMCCGAAGTYNLTQPDMARDLAERKIRHIQATGATMCVTGNVGCAMQIQSEAARLGVDLKVVHPMTLLYEAYIGSSN